MLRGRPDGTFFLRRKGPSLLVLTYVASTKRPNSNANTPTSGARNRKSYPASRSPRIRDMLGSPQGEKLGKGVSLEGVRDDLAGSTFVQVQVHGELVSVQGSYRRGSMFCVSWLNGACVVLVALEYVVALADVYDRTVHEATHGLCRRYLLGLFGILSHEPKPHAWAANNMIVSSSP